jgi:hypothetical protein
MRIASIIATAAAGAALLIGPSLASGDPPVGSAGADHSAAGSHPAEKQQPPSTPGANASASAKAKAYGRFCQPQSKKHVAGQKGTPFSQCVTAMAHLAHGDVTSARAACKPLSKKHVKGTKGTPFSLCVQGAAKLHAQMGT